MITNQENPPQLHEIYPDLSTMINNYCIKNKARVDPSAVEKLFCISRPEPGWIDLILRHTQQLNMLTLDFDQYFTSTTVSTIKGIKITEEGNPTDLLKFFYELNKLRIGLSIEKEYDCKKIIKLLSIISGYTYKQCIEIRFTQQILFNLSILNIINRDLNIVFYNYFLEKTKMEQLLLLGIKLKGIEVNRVLFKSCNDFIQIINKIQCLNKLLIINFNVYQEQNLKEGFQPISSKNLRHLKSSINQLRISAVRFNTEDFSHLLNSTLSLRCLIFIRCSLGSHHFYGQNFLRPDLQKFAMIQQIPSDLMTLSGVYFVTRMYRNLKILILSRYSRIGNQSMIAISNLQKLEILSIDKCSITNNGVIYVRRLKNLTSLELLDSCVTDKVLLSVFLRRNKKFQFSEKNLKKSSILNEQNLKKMKQNINKGLEIRLKKEKV